MSESKHTPTPWQFDGVWIEQVEQVGSDGCTDLIALAGDDHHLSSANAAFIVHCVNNHQQLVDALDFIMADQLLCGPEESRVTAWHKAVAALEKARPL